MTTCTRVVTRHSSRPFSPFFGCHLLFSLSFTKISIYRTFREMGELLIFLNSVVYCENRFKSLEPYYIFFECVYIPANSIPVVSCWCFHCLIREEGTGTSEGVAFFFLARSSPLFPNKTMKTPTERLGSSLVFW